MDSYDIIVSMKTTSYNLEILEWSKTKCRIP